MAKLLIVRKAGDKAPKLSATKVKAAFAEIDKRARVSRPNVVSFMLDGSFNKLPVVKQSVIDKAAYNRADDLIGWEIPSDDLGRVGEATPSSRESVRLWIKQNLSEYGIDPDSVAVVLVD